VQIRDFVMAARDLLLAAGHDEHAAHCRGCGTYLGPAHTEDHLRRTLTADDDELLALCAPCRRRSFGAKMRTLVPGRPHTPATGDA
jgi:hypothetical protein